MLVVRCCGTRGIEVEDGRDLEPDDEGRPRLVLAGGLVNSGAPDSVCDCISFSCKDRGTLVRETIRLFASVTAGGSSSARRIKRLE